MNLYKESGYTSSDAVAKLRGLLHFRKIGHTGTLDPAATGVLPLCLGSATKVCSMLTDETKEYVAGMRLGMTTDTLDLTGAVLTTHPVAVTQEEVTSAIRSFVGGYEQLPPMYSAKKVNGKRLYAYARDGANVERTPVWVSIASIQVEELKLPDIRLRVVCSRGTYIRSLCADIGEKLGTGACMTSLERTRVGQFCSSEAVTFAQIETAIAGGTFADLITPVDTLFPSYLKAAILTKARKWLYNGNELVPEVLLFARGDQDTQALLRNDIDIHGSTGEGREPLQRPSHIRVYDPEGVFWALYRWSTSREAYVPEQMFPDIYQ